MQHSHPFDRHLTGSSPAPPNLAPVVPSVELRQRECRQPAPARSQVVPHERVGTTAALLGCLAFGMAACSKEPTAPTSPGTPVASVTVTPAAASVAMTHTLQLAATLRAADSSELTGRPVSSLRSEEHTSELQSPCNLVCRLLLEKKKKKTPK